MPVAIAKSRNATGNCLCQRGNVLRSESEAHSAFFAREEKGGNHWTFSAELVCALLLLMHYVMDFTERSIAM